ncbi:RHO1 GDP-GTP exchange protein 2 [Tulasnella sp. 408]|nr:RHO1 GDP-GTP exchange protein 2 [Tulasnella sp. 408]
MFEVGKEKSSNPAFVQFVQETERLPESRKLNSYLTRPTARLPRYTLLVESVLKYTPDHHPDKELLEKVVKTILGLLQRVSEESRETERRVILLQLDQQSVFWDVEQVDLRLRDRNRKLLYMGRLRLRSGRENYDLQVFLLDHALLMVNERAKQRRFHLYKQPIPLELLVVEAKLEYIPRPPRTSLLEPLLETDSKTEYPIWLRHLGRKGYTLMLRANTVVDRDKWLEEIAKQQEVIRTRNAVFQTLSLDRESYRWCVVLNCAVPLDGGNLLVYGSKHGVHLPNLRGGSSGMLMGLFALPDVKQVNLLVEFELLVLLSERSVMTVPLDALNDRREKARTKRVKKVATDISFFKVGTYLGRTLLCLVNATPLRSTIKILKMNEKRSSFKEFMLGGSDAFRAFKQTFIEIHNVESGQLVQIIPGKDIRCLFADTVPSITRPAANNGNTSLELREGPDMDVFQEQPTGSPGAAIGPPSTDPDPRDAIIVVSDGKVMAVQLAPSKIGSAVGHF